MKTTIKRIITICILLALISVLCLVCVACNFSKPKEFIAEDGNGNKMMEGIAYELPKNLKFINVATVSESDASGIAEKTVTVKATVYPANAQNKDLTWAIGWVNASSEWANGKAVGDYLTVSTNGNIADITCRAPFGEQAKLTVTSVDNPNAFATCTLDCKSLATIGYKFAYTRNGDGSDAIEFATINDVSWGKTGHNDNPDTATIFLKYYNAIYGSYIITPFVTYGVGTVKPEVVFAPTISIDNGSPTGEFAQKFEEKFSVSPHYASGHTDFELENGSYKVGCFALFASFHNLIIDIPTAKVDDVIKIGFDRCIAHIYTAQTKVDDAIYPISFCYGVDKETCTYFAVESVSVDNANIVF